jgi:hypothetical protein
LQLEKIGKMIIKNVTVKVIIGGFIKQAGNYTNDYGKRIFHKKIKIIAFLVGPVCFNCVLQKSINC